MKTKSLFFILIALQFPPLSRGEPEGGYVAHEWGTFTSVQGADGIQLEWNPLITTELPAFVYNHSKPSGDPRRRLTAFGPKTAFQTLQRMETPVIYFYSDKERTVEVTVKFPQGLITEWFPQAQAIGPSTIQPRSALVALDKLMDKTGLHPSFNFSSLDTKKGIADSLIRWRGVKILPHREQPELAGLLPTDKSGSHYYAAREADANALQVNALVNGSHRPERERFLFYRGIGNFQAPLELTAGASEDYVQVRNTGTEDLANLFVLRVREGQGKFIFVDRLASGADKTVKLDPNKNFLRLDDLVRQIGSRIQEALVKEGLYEPEARAMVNTWRDSWFEEQGLRVLYTLPRPWTDRILPITIEPKPRELIRVMVGRAELITPTMEWELLKQIVRFSDGDPALSAQAIEGTRKLGLGRFAEPTMRRVLGRMPSREFSQNAWNLLQLASKPSVATKTLAGK